MAARVPGIDISKQQPQVDWPAVRGAGYAFCYIKATEGVGYVSPTLDEQLAGARGAGLVTGLYHFARPDTNSPQQEAADFAAQLARLGASGPGNLPPCLDVEKDAPNLAGWIKGFVDALRGQTHRNEVMVYANSGWFGEKLDPNAWVDPGVMLWVAHYGVPAGEPGYASERVVMHQYASDGRVAGLPGDTDLNVSLVDLPLLTGAGAPASAPTAQTSPPRQPYVVQPGDTLSEVGARFGIDQSRLARANGINDPDLIYVGQVLQLPS